jgi:hypothetical protein
MAAITVHYTGGDFNELGTLNCTLHLESGRPSARRGSVTFSALIWLPLRYMQSIFLAPFFQITSKYLYMFWCQKKFYTHVKNKCYYVSVYCIILDFFIENYR